MQIFVEHELISFIFASSAHVYVDNWICMPTTMLFVFVSVIAGLQRPPAVNAAGAVGFRFQGWMYGSDFLPVEMIFHV